MGTDVIRVMLVDDHLLVRAAIRRLFVSQPDLVVVGEAADARQALSLVGRMRPHVVLMDLQLPGLDGVGATGALLAVMPLLRVLVLSATCTPDQVRDALAAGACGYLLKDGSVEQLYAGVRAAARGETPMAPLAMTLCNG